MGTSKNSTEKPLAQLTLSLEGSHANLSPQQVAEKERQMTATSGQKCYESYEKQLPAGSLVKMLAASLLGTAEWYSTKSSLTWKPRVTKSGRLLFQLAPSVHPIGVTESGLLRTPDANMDRGNRTRENLQGRLKRGMPLNLNDQMRAMNLGLIPTPQARDWKGSGKKGRDSLDYLVERGITKGETGEKTGQKLQPGFALWMMGYPTDHLDLKDGEMPLSKAQEMRLSRKLQK